MSLPEIVIQKLEEASDVRPLTASTRVEELALDSLEFVQAVLEIEKASGVAIPDDDAANFETVGDVIAFVHQHSA